GSSRRSAASEPGARRLRPFQLRVVRPQGLLADGREADDQLLVVAEVFDAHDGADPELPVLDTKAGSKPRRRRLVLVLVAERRLLAHAIRPLRRARVGVGPELPAPAPRRPMAGV